MLTRLGLFVETVSKFLRELKRVAPSRLEAIDQRYTQRYLEREGYFADVKKEQARRRLPVVAKDLLALVTAFAGDEEVSTWKSCRLLRRLFKEQCEVVEANDASSSNNAVTVEAPERSVSESGRQGDADTAARSPPQPAQDDEEPDSREQDAQTAPPPTHVDVTEQAESAEKATTAVRGGRPVRRCGPR